jgi:lysophospholipase L1-like esterase
VCALSVFLLHCGGSSEEDSKGSSGGSGGSTGGSGGSAGSSTGGSAGTAAGGTGGGTGGSAGGQACLSSKYDGVFYVNYEQFSPVFNSKCAGTNHQDVQDVERLAFLGDSITEGYGAHYRGLLTNAVTGKWPGVEVTNCAENGAETGDFFSGGNQIGECFPAPEPKKTLIVITMGGNDGQHLVKDEMGPTEADAAADVIVANMREAVQWLKDPVNFPNGSYVFFANIYEYTDLTGEFGSCLAANFIGLNKTYTVGLAALAKMREGYMKAAVDFGADMTFLGELFCGHGFKANDTTQQCYEPGSATWFDLTCIHPTNEGHQQIADQFWNAITE